MPKIALDTNLLVRYIVQDDAKQAAKASAVIDRLSADNQAFISCIVLCELNWVLKSAYKITKEDRVTILRRVLAVSVFEIERLACCIKALRRYETEQADFSDYLIHETALAAGYAVVVSFDEKACKSLGFVQP
jgi:predicted nucleic-acid-binding protein